MMIIEVTDEIEVAVILNVVEIIKRNIVRTDTFHHSRTP